MGVGVGAGVGVGVGVGAGVGEGVGTGLVAGANVSASGFFDSFQLISLTYIQVLQDRWFQY